VTRAEPLVPANVGRVVFDPYRALWLWGMLLVTAVAALPAVTLGRTLVSLLLSLLTLCLGHSVGLHRGLIHRSYECGRVLRGLLAWLFVLSGLGGPLAWARLHAVRDYWQNRRDCPRLFAYDHSLARDFLWNLHCSFRARDARAEARLPRDVLTDPWLRFLERTWPLHVLALGALLWLADGPGAVAVCLCARTAAGILGHWFIGYAAHVWGERRYAIPGARETGTNVWILGLISFGEGFHNNHHAFPGSARMGLLPREFDLGWLCLRLFRWFGWVRALQSVSRRRHALRSRSSRNTHSRWGVCGKRSTGHVRVRRYPLPTRTARS
jgi:stearoyl-CoA desaturase (delta-9 desaturase)